MLWEWVNKVLRKLSCMVCCSALIRKVTVPAVPEYRGGLEGGKGFIPFALARQVCETAVGDAFDGSFVADACKGFQNGVHGKLEQRGKEYGCGYAEHRPSVGFVRTEIPEGKDEGDGGYVGQDGARIDQT